tara:strand:+ start:27 stop:1127 length:1101 start_codon:yes stop_codon:yes gene_type:complete
MSLKKDKNLNKDQFYMNLALNLAKEKIGLTGSNPSVGCVIVKNSQLISSGQTSNNGRPHAEFNAIKSCKKNLKGSSIYISLEPCSHYGKTPPCTSIIIKSGIKKVFYAIDDIDLRSSKKATIILKKKKIIVKKNFLSKKAKNLYKSYFFTKKNKFPYVTGKIACSKDLLISSKKKYITNEHSRKISHLLRYKNQGILISSSTLNLDNPRLSCRLPGLEKFSPVRFIVDKNLKINSKSYIVKTAKTIKTYVFYNKDKINKMRILKKLGIKLIKTKLNKEKMLDLSYVLSKIKNIGINYLLVEGGRNLTLSFIDSNLFNEFYLFKSHLKLKQNGKINISKILHKLRNIFTYKKKINTYLDKNELLNYY